MPVVVPAGLPSGQIVKSEGIPVFEYREKTEKDAPFVKVGILNLMPKKEETEAQFLRVLGNTPIVCHITFLYTKTRIPQNTPFDHLKRFYKTFDEVKDEFFDGFIITGAPVEHLPFEEVDYWEELTRIMDWCETNVGTTYYVCWAPQAALYHRYGIAKYTLKRKMFGVFKHTITDRNEYLFKGFDDVFYAPHSRHTEIRREDLLRISEIEILSESDKAGVYIAATRNRRHIFVTGHPEYDPLTLKQEYERDKAKGMDIDIPENYFPNDDPSRTPVVNWRSHGHLLFANWLNYYVYQKRFPK